MLLIHEISHAVASGGHGKIWQARMEKAAKRADHLGRGRLASLLRQEISACQDAEDWREEAYRDVENWLMAQPGLSLAQVKRAVADQYGLLVSEVNAKLRRNEGVYRAAKLEAQAASVRRVAGLTRDEGSA